MMIEKGEFLARKLARCWRQFVRLRGTTLSLAKAYAALEINKKSVKSMPFELLYLQINSAGTIQIIKALLDRLESHITPKQECIYTGNVSHLENIDHLLKRIVSPSPRANFDSGRNSGGVKNVGSRREAAHSRPKLSRYPARVVLCNYMILGHPDAFCSGNGECEIALAKSAEIFIREFELLIRIILDGPIQTPQEEAASAVPSRLTFRSQLEAFDKAWCCYLYCFVVWKVQDAKLFEEDFVRAACQLELSMSQTCKLTAEGDHGGLTSDMKAIQNQVTESQKHPRTGVQHLFGEAGLERMDCALSEMRSRIFESKEGGSSLTPPPVHMSSSSSPSSPGSLDRTGETSNLTEGHHRSGSIVYSLFKADDSSLGNEVDSSTSRDTKDAHLSRGAMLITENELLVNETVHEHRRAFTTGVGVISDDRQRFQEKVRETMEEAFWDCLLESMNQNEPDYSCILKLMKEVRDELCEMSPSSWRQEIVESIDIDILSQVLKSETLDMDYLGRILDFALVTMQKLSAPANEDKMKAAHQKVLEDLREISQDRDKLSASFALSMSMCFVLQQIQTLKLEISKARLGMLETLLEGPPGVEYLRKAFTDRHGTPTDAPASLPLTRQWLSVIQADSEKEWDEYVDSLSALKMNVARYCQGLPPTTLRTGGNVLKASTLNAATSNVTGGEQPECKGEKVDLLLRLGLLKVVSEVEGLTVEALPETLKLNFSRLRAVQSQLQKIFVICTSILVLRQMLLSENLVSPVDMENVVSECFKQLSKLLDSSEDVGLSEIVETINGFSKGGDPEKLQARKDIIANMLAKSLRAEDSIFSQVSRTIYLAARGIVLGGSGATGRKLAEAALRRVGAALLTEKLVEAVEVLVVAATVSANVHGAWYEQVIKNM